jgi:Ca-activated chloride channel family protein
MTSRTLVVIPVLLAGAAVVSPAQQVFRSGIDLVHVGVTVLDRKGNLVKGLRPSDFEVREDGRVQRLQYFASGEDTDELPPLHLGLLFDTSGSMTEDVKLSRSAAIKFLNAATRAADVTLVDFDTEVRVARYGPGDFPRLVERIRTRAPDGMTALYDATGVYLNGAADQDGLKVLVVYTDGGDTSSSMNFGDCLSLLRMSDVTVYAIGFLQHQSSSLRISQELHLRQMAATTGGEAFFPLSLDQLDKVYEKILEEMAARYTLGYVSDDSRADGAWRDLEIRLTRPDLRGARIRMRDGYYGPAKPPGR